MNNNTVYDGCQNDYAEKQEKILEDIIKEWFDISKIDFSRLKVNPLLLRKVIERVHMRKQYYEIFHNDMQISEYKHTALTAYWIVKLKPFWIDPIETDSKNELERIAYINEHIAMGIMIGILTEFNDSIINMGTALFSNYYKEMLYSIKFRDLNKESFIIMLDPFYYLYQYSSTVSEDGAIKI